MADRRSRPGVSAGVPVPLGSCAGGDALKMSGGHGCHPAGVGNSGVDDTGGIADARPPATALESLPLKGRPRHHRVVE